MTRIECLQKHKTEGLVTQPSLRNLWWELWTLLISWTPDYSPQTITTSRSTNVGHQQPFTTTRWPCYTAPEHSETTKMKTLTDPEMIKVNDCEIPDYRPLQIKTGKLTDFLTNFTDSIVHHEKEVVTYLLNSSPAPPVAISLQKSTLRHSAKTLNSQQAEKKSALTSLRMCSPEVKVENSALLRRN